MVANHNNKPVIFLSVLRAIIARNLLMNDFIKLLSAKYRVVILTPMHDDSEFKTKFGQYEIEPLYPRSLTPRQKKLEQKFISLHKALIYNPTVEVRTKYGMDRRSENVNYKSLRFFVQKYILGKIFAHDIFRNLARYLDKLCFPCHLYDDLIKKYQPKLLFSSVINGDDEALLVRNCKAHGIKVIGMPKSWDNASKFGFREKANHLLVWGDYMKEEAMKFQCYKDKEISIVGIPQFDYYTTLKIPSREEFFRKFNLNPNKKLIFIGSEGPANYKDYVVPFLKEKIQDGALENYQILIRPHFSYQEDLDRFSNSIDNQIVMLDNDYQRSKFKDGTELSFNNIINLMASIKYSTVAITGVSTLILDITANGKNAIIYNFDPTTDMAYKDSVKRYQSALWFQEIHKMNLDNLANTKEELIAKIKRLEINPDFKQAERQQLLERFCYRLDGHSGRRIFEFIDQQMFQLI